MNPIFNLKKPSFFSSSSSSSPPPVQNQNPPLRIADILHSDDDDEEEVQVCIFKEKPPMGGSKDCPNSIDCSSPRRIVSRWIAGLRRCRVKRVKDESELSNLTTQESRSVNCLNESETGQSSRNDSSFNLGVGCGLLYLIAVSKTELTKMIDMRMQMEALLQSTRQELLKKEELCKAAESNDVFAYSAIKGAETPDVEILVLAESSRVTVCDQSSKWETPEKEEGMGQLEAELEAELERLQFHLDREKLLKHPEQLNIKVTDEHTASSKSQTISSEVFDPQPQETDTDCGVSPNELERRLHELLEARQQEQIRELEAVIESLKDKLYEKELEASWWKGTARFISRHAMEPSGFTSPHDPRLITLQGEHKICDKEKDAN
ncbi:protein POLAR LOCALIZATION DURING ASYMMETRIC DIVISION AND REDISTRIBUTION isoform X2 [Ricinus communis]|uniref:Transcription factor, putative n=1 Tax=Ricinus communis TaxID=3988 RepID=B9RNW1_RICCO|nr:protein POLAR LOCALIZATION DURING ASYMMETRIC DIVISION AND REDISTRIBUTION isoform X2 [Ricinus communis]EEF46879.1 transcription factor, putative [Ricinus communis]|eukprot:XP_002515430.1 protein POLAR LOCALIZATION DURING ASYMMETRIC DIVISION AND REDISTRIBUTION isoform X2 [Ricinus communis]